MMYTGDQRKMSMTKHGGYIREIFSRSCTSLMYPAALMRISGCENIVIGEIKKSRHKTFAEFLCGMLVSAELSISVRLAWSEYQAEWRIASDKWGILLMLAFWQPPKSVQEGHPM